MANSRFEYVKKFEEHELCLLDTFMVVRVDGKGFTKFSELHDFKKPNDKKALEVMNKAAFNVCEEFKDIFLAYGDSDEYSFAFTKQSDIFQRRREKIVTTITSMFTAHYCLNFEKITNRALKSVPSFDGRVVVYPNLKCLKDYFAWRQVDCHINNLYNTCFWKLVKEGGETRQQAEATLKGTLSDFKQELLFTRFNTNYSKTKEIYKKGSIIKRTLKIDPAKQTKYEEARMRTPDTKLSLPRGKFVLSVVHEDLIKDDFWNRSFPDINREF